MRKSNKKESNEKKKDFRISEKLSKLELLFIRGGDQGNSEKEEGGQ
jgi:hypothetical protein